MPTAPLLTFQVLKDTAILVRDSTVNSAPSDLEDIAFDIERSDKPGHVSVLTKTFNMRKLLFLFLLLSVVVYLVGCSKCFWSEEDPRCYVVNPGQWKPWPPAQPWNVVDQIYLSCDNNGAVSWCGPNFYAFSFSQHGVYSAQYHNSHWFYDPDTPRQCYMRYVGPSPLFDTSKIVFRNLWHVDYRMDSSFLRRPMFEARFLDNDSLFQTFSFGDSGIVSVGYFYDITEPDVPGDWSKGWHWRIPLFDSTKLTNDTLTKTLLRYLAPDALHADQVHYGQLNL